MFLTYFGHEYIHHQELVTILLNYHIGRIVLDVCWRFGAAEACNTDTTPTQSHRISNTLRTKNNTTNVVIQQNSHKLLMMDILISETRWAQKKWNKIASDIKLVFYSSNITMMHVPINIIFFLCFYLMWYPASYPTSVTFDPSLRGTNTDLLSISENEWLRRIFCPQGDEGAVSGKTGAVEFKTT